MTDTLGPYELVRLIGRGGMGEVHLARDTRLEREVALKLLPPDLVDDPDRRARFLREARAAAALNHPNITTIHDIGEEAGRTYLAQEFLDGRPLSDVIAERTLPLAELAALAVPLADALAFAHDRGVIHRDLKADNVVVTARGDPKILDFGLAKVLREAEAPAGVQSTTLTIAGAVFGTPGAMSPEQALGKVVDARSDVFSFGSLLYEMASGKPAFLGATVQETLDKVLRAEPEPLAKLRRDLPSDFVAIVDKALRKDPTQRYQSMADLAADLRHFKQKTDSGLVPPGAQAPAARRGRHLLGAGAVVGVAVLLLWWTGALGGGGADAAPQVYRQLQLTYGIDGENWPSLSADGETLYYVSRSGGDLDIFMRRVDGSRALNLTEDHPDDDYDPAVSPDGRSVAFRSERDGGGVFVMGSLGESPRKLAEQGFHPAWSPDGSRLVVCDDRVNRGEIRILGKSALWIIDVATGARTLAYEGDAVQPRWSPDGARLLAWQSDNGQRDLLVVPLDGGRPFQLTDDPALDWAAVYGDGGQSVIFSSDRGGSHGLWKIPIDETGHAIGPPAPLTSGAGHAGVPSASADGRRIVFTNWTGNEFEVVKMTFDDQGLALGPERQLAVPPGFWATDASPDGRFVVGFGGGGQEDLYRIDSTTGAIDQLTDDGYRDRFPKYLPDGETLFFYSNRSGSYQIWRARADGTDLRQITRVPGHAFAMPYVSGVGDKLVLTGHVGSLGQGKTHIYLTPTPEAPIEQLPTELDVPRYGNPAGFIEWSSDDRGIYFEVAGPNGGREHLWMDLDTMRCEPRSLPPGLRPIAELRGGRAIMQDVTDGALLVVEADGRRRPLTGGPRLEVIEGRSPLRPMVFHVCRDQASVFHQRRDRIGHLWLLER